MRRMLILCVALLCHAVVFAQIQRGVVGEYNTDDFPRISFIWSTADPDRIMPSQFVVIENNERLDIDVVPLEPDYTDIPDVNVLFIVEDMASHKGQMRFSKAVIDSFFSETSIDDGDMFNIAVFNRKEYSQNILTLLSPSFTTDVASLKQKINSYQASSRYYSDYSNHTDLYLAINEGIEYLKTQPGDRCGIIVVITAGLNMKASGASTEMETVRSKALDVEVPVYVITYPLYGDAPEMSLLAEDTYGLNCSTEEVRGAVESLKSYYAGFDKRIYGQRYRITFESSSSRDGEAHSISLFVDKVAQVVPQYYAPKVTLSLWIKEHILISVLLFCLILAVIGVTVWLLVRASAKRKKTIHKLKEEVYSVKNSRQIEQEEFDRKHKEEEDCRRQELEHKLLEDMQRRNLSPKLCCNLKGRNLQYTIRTIKTTIGRGESNDMVLSEGTVSGCHAEILFNGEGFDIVDKNSTNGVKINGCKVERKELRNGDKIQLGKVMMVYFD